MSQSIHQEVVVNANPQQVYAALINEQQFQQVTGGAPTTIKAEAGGPFSCFGGMITGRTVELVPDQRIVQAWRASTWDAGVYSIVKFDLKKEGTNTRIVFDHTGFPEDQKQHLEEGWYANYWEPLKKYLSPSK